jgi:predicted regulator of Ras-like GTPase activity (Roadblock/LC7/MglB family)
MMRDNIRYRSQDLEHTLRQLHYAVPGITASVIVNIDGLLMAAYPATSYDNYDDNPTGSPQVAAMAATLVGLADRVLKRLAQGDMKRLWMEAEAGYMVVYPAGRAMLAILVEKEAKPGMLLYAARRACEDIKRTLGFTEEPKKTTPEDSTTA